MREVELPLLSPSGEIGKCKIFFSTQPPWEIKLVTENLRTISTEADDLFECLLQLREKLEIEGQYIICKGVYVNVHPSSLSRQMNGGILAYKLEIGQPARVNNSVQIFETGEPDKIATVAEQRQYYERWLKSL